ncbi:hypothetical protein BJ508DRAFT_313870 [Ascobolus immersus RN42]|uniref:Uncharacterized protein n=1 Tax=Ascobolus immersus RN42 TaxID=1160509 RepID=A0A3N4HNK3_ASCIM|nr:hypothetical protein BJ508DRAFT_313870 [Ascobolus immersus RN42]
MCVGSESGNWEVSTFVSVNFYKLSSIRSLEAKHHKEKYPDDPDFNCWNSQTENHARQLIKHHFLLLLVRHIFCYSAPATLPDPGTRSQTRPPSIHIKSRVFYFEVYILTQHNRERTNRNSQAPSFAGTSTSDLIFLARSLWINSTVILSNEPAKPGSALLIGCNATASGRIILLLYQINLRYLCCHYKQAPTTCVGLAPGFKVDTEQPRAPSTNTTGSSKIFSLPCRARPDLPPPKMPLHAAAESSTGAASNRTETQSAPPQPTQSEIMRMDANQVVALLQRYLSPPMMTSDIEALTTQNIHGRSLLRLGKDSDSDCLHKLGVSAGTCDNIEEFIANLGKEGRTPTTDSDVSNPVDSYLEKVRNWGAELIRLGKEQEWTIANLSDPEKSFDLLFPSPDGASNRFELKDGKFEFIGRERLKELHHRLMGRDEASTMHCYGTEGYGKSYIIAAVVVALRILGKRVVYLPDCTILGSNFMLQIRRALYMAFHNKPKKLDKISTLETPDDVAKFCLDPKNGEIIFVFDKYDSLRDLSTEHQMISAENRELFRKYLNDMSAGSKRLFASTSNDLGWRKLQLGNSKLYCWMVMNGGFTETEMKTWWSFKKARGEIPSGTDIASMEDVTGRVPLFLNEALAAFSNWTNAINSIHEQALSFDRRISDSRTMEESRKDDYYSALEDIITMSETAIPHYKVLDHRYYYFDPLDDIIHAIAPFLQRSAQRALYKKPSSDLTMDDYNNIIYRMPSNRSVVGFAAEGAAIASIRESGLSLRNYRQFSAPAEQISFEGFDIITAADVPKYGPMHQMFTPLRYNFHAIDFLLLSTNGGKTVAPTLADLAPVRVTLDYNGHSDSETKFFRNPKLFLGIQRVLKQAGVEVGSVVFIWMVPNGFGAIDVPANSLGFDHPAYTRVLICFNDVNPKIMEALRKAGINPANPFEYTLQPERKGKTKLEDKDLNKAKAKEDTEAEEYFLNDVEGKEVEDDVEDEDQYSDFDEPITKKRRRATSKLSTANAPASKMAKSSVPENPTKSIAKPATSRSGRGK